MIELLIAAAILLAGAMWMLRKPKGCNEGVHDFEAVYDYGQPKDFNAQHIGSGTALAIIEATKSKTYVAHVCTKCGKKVVK